MVLEMSKSKRYKTDQNGYMYYDGKWGKVYVGHRDMIGESDGELADVQPLLGDEIVCSSQVIEFIPCEYCNGYGMWPGDYIPFTKDELTWQLSEDCPKCGSNNHEEYFETNSPSVEGEEVEVYGTISIFHKAIENFKRSIKCAESLDTQAAKTV
jgi:hypothetical protein